MSLKRQPLDDQSLSADDRKVIPFRPKNSRILQKQVEQVQKSSVQPADLSSYERSREPDDYRHRMLMNVAAGIFTIVLTAFGIWLAMSIADLRKTTDCILVGRADCAAIPPHQR